MWLIDSITDVLQHLISEPPQGNPHILHPLPDDLLEEGSQLKQGPVLSLSKPTLDVDAVLWLDLEVLR